MGKSKGEGGMVGKEYIPSRGDIVFLDFQPTRGHEQSGRRPAIILSPHIYNQKAGLALVCPITSKIKGYPFEVAIDQKGMCGSVLTDQIRSIDFRERNAELACICKPQYVREIVLKISLLLGISS